MYFFHTYIAKKIDNSQLTARKLKKIRQCRRKESLHESAESCLRAAINCPICRSCYNAGRFTRTSDTSKYRSQFFRFITAVLDVIVLNVAQL